ncbi:hypothetical protein [Mycobacterium uberis]|nr:hypothetical protein [Mycobacterium uberis]
MADVDAAYSEMWGQDAAKMYDYENATAAAMAATPCEALSEIVHEIGLSK